MIRDNRFYFHQTGKAGDPDTAQVQDIQSGAVRLNLGFGVGPYADFGLSVPYFADLIGDTKAKDLSGSGIGDAILSVKLGQSLAGPSVLTGAILGNLSIPSKSKRGFLPKQPDYLITDTAAGLPRFFSSHEISGTAQSILTLDLTGLETRPPFRSSLNAGFAHSGLKGSAPQVLLGGGMEWIPLPTLEFFANIQSQTRLSRMGEFAKIGNEFSYAAVGFCATGDDGIYFSVSVQKSLANRQFHVYANKISDGIMNYESRSQPAMSIAFNLGWTGTLATKDSDNDGIPEKEDLCPNEPEDKDGFQDQDGCPELDNDEDSIYDAVDKCPNLAEDRDGFQDEDGCPDPDNEYDGILDAQDKCPNEPEDMDGFEDYDGCPELDNDKDGILDSQDKCPNDPETYNGFEDTDGCPDIHRMD